MTYLHHTKPCNDCPFRKKAPAGWLGANRPRQFAGHAETGELPCHATVDYESEDWDLEQESAPKCAGALAVMANSCVMPYDAQARKDRDAVGKRDDVFRYFGEFIAYHEAASVKSWEM